MNKSLVALDTDHIKRYVFATGKLKEVRGASALLDQLNREEMPRLVQAVDGEIIYANGGGGLFVVDTERADKFIQTVRQAYRQQTKIASVTGVTVPLPKDTTENVGSQLGLLRCRLRAAKDGRNASKLPLTHPLLHACDACGVQYAQKTDQEERLCEGCYAKRQHDVHIKAAIQRWTTGKVPPDSQSSRLWERMISQLQLQSYPTEGYERPEDLDKLGDLSSPGGYMGLIYADGDGMGREIERITGLKEMARFAQAVDDSVYQAVLEAIVKHLKPKYGSVWPFDVLLLGGDDLVMVTRAQSAIEVALHIVERFPILTQQRWGEPLNLSASVVLAHVNFPIGSLLELAESGLKFAKCYAAKRRLDGQTIEGGMLNFVMINSANHLDFGRYYDQVLKQQVDGEKLYLTQRPYTASEMRALLSKVRDVKEANIPRTKLQQLRAAVFRSRHQAMIDAMMIILRMRNENQREVLLGLVGETLARRMSLPWIAQKEKWMTPVLDIIELLDFVQQREITRED